MAKRYKIPFTDYSFNISSTRAVTKKKVPKRTTPIDENKKPKISTSVPAGRVSVPTPDNHGLENMGQFINIVKPSVSMEAIPYIRSLYKTNEDVGSVIFDLVRLTNTGHKIHFEESLDPRMVDKMTAHLKEKSKSWNVGSAGMDGIINKLITQIWVSGAISYEAIPDPRLYGVDRVALVNPETIRYALEKGKYVPYQQANRILKNKGGYIKLNDNTFKYISMIGDEDAPYGIPPFLTALSSLRTQKDMKANINHILEQLGLLGYLEVKLDKPDQMPNESVSAYEARLSSLLTQTKTNVMAGFKEGVVVGYQEDHEFEFHATTKNLAGVEQVFDMNENQIANGLKTHKSFLGLQGGGGEGQLGIVFTKMLSQLSNVQAIVSQALSHIYTLELVLAGYEFRQLSIEFKPSTITDDLKIQQSKEIKQRILHNLWVDGIIGQEQYADAFDYQKPNRVVKPPEPQANTGDKDKKKEDREKDKDKSDRKVRDKNKPQPKRRDTETKPR